MEKLTLILVLSLLVAMVEVRTEEQVIDSTPRLFFGTVSTTMATSRATITRTIFQPRTCIVVPAGVTSTCLRSSTAPIRSARHLAFDANVHARHLRLPADPSGVESVEPTASPVFEDRFLSLSEPEVESSQQDIGTYEILGLPDACGEERFFVANMLTIVTSSSTLDPFTTTVTSLFPATNTRNRVSITVGNCIPSPALAYPFC